MLISALREAAMLPAQMQGTTTSYNDPAMVCLITPLMTQRISAKPPERVEHRCVQRECLCLHGRSWQVAWLTRRESMMHVEDRCGFVGRAIDGIGLQRASQG